MTYRPVRVLAPEVARKIAAGEVVDRPAALVRELLDNAIDSGADKITITLQAGGTGLTEAADNGSGMTEADLILCWLPHATSKIINENDLLHTETLGFRGEALASMAAVARLEIITAVTDGGLAAKLAVGPGGFDAPVRIEHGHRQRGTTVRVSALFDAFPARKQFLKRAAAESALCKQAFIDKALAFPEIAFRLMVDGELKANLPAAGNRRERFAATHPAPEAAFLHEITGEGKGFSLSVVVGGPEWTRNDRRLQYAFVNGRRIYDFALLHALEYGVQGWFPNGVHPVGAVYIDIDPSLVDFNIHPAKREARFKDEASLHRAITTALSAHFNRVGADRSVPSRKDGADYPDAAQLIFSPTDPRHQVEAVADRGHSYTPNASFPPTTPEARLAMDALLDGRFRFAPLPGRGNNQAIAGSDAGSDAGRNTGMDARADVDGKLIVEDDFRFFGIAFGLFLAAERRGRFYLIDQHAAHERILFDRLRTGPVARQDLLVPYPFATDSPAEDRFLQTSLEALAALGIILDRDGDGWVLTALPSAWSRDDETTVRAILDLRASSDLAKDWYAMLACRAAAKDGDYLDAGSAAALAKAALDLPIPRCPHGRPIWFEISLEELLRAVQRSR